MYSREIDGEILTLASSSFLYDRVFVLVDYETHSLWYHLREGLVSIAGPYQGRILEILPSTFTKWPQWVNAHPDTRFFDARRSRQYEPPEAP